MIQKLIDHPSRETILSFFKQKAPRFVPEPTLMDEVLLEMGQTRFQELYKLGEILYENSDELLVFSCKSNQVLNARSSKKQQYEIARKLLKEERKDAALFFFYDDSRKFRFSFVRSNYVGTKRDFSSWKRHTFFIDPQKPNKTFLKQISKCTFESFAGILDAFSIDAVTAEFYNEFTPTLS